MNPSFPANAIMRRPALSSRAGGIPSIVDLRIKFSRLLFHHDQLKIAFRQMNSQVRGGLLEAEDVFASLAIQLMKLVGLKTEEMAKEGRISSIVISENDRSKEHTRVNTGIASDERSEIQKADENVRAKIMEEEHLLARANQAGKELREKQKVQLMLLVHLLKQIEVQVNASQDDIFQSLSNNRVSIQNYFQKAVKYVSAIHQRNEMNGMPVIMLKLLKCTYDYVGSALGEVEVGVEELMGKLAEKMCGPMVNYVNDLRYEMTAGTYLSILAVLEEMGRSMRLRRLELEEARKKVREAEKIRLDMLSKLKGTEERMRKMKEASVFCLETKKWPVQLNVTEKPLTRQPSVEEDQAKDEKLLWELLRKRRKLQTPDSPFAPNGLLGIGTSERNLKSTRIQAIKPPISCKPPPPRRRSARLLGSSPSVATQHFIPHFRLCPNRAGIC